jgi:hypothetical protein
MDIKTKQNHVIYSFGDDDPFVLAKKLLYFAAYVDDHSGYHRLLCIPQTRIAIRWAT